MVVHTHTYGVSPLAQAYGDLTRSDLLRDCIDKLKREPRAVFDIVAPTVCRLVGETLKKLTRQVSLLP